MPVLLVRVAIAIGLVSALVTSCQQAKPGEVIRQLEAGELTIEARGKSRAWHFTYPDEQASSGVLTVPAGVDVVIQLRSDDYLYVFSCPDLALKEIAVPDLDYAISFRVEQPGDFELAMDPMCGFRLPPDQTMGNLRVLPEKEFRRWLISQ